MLANEFLYFSDPPPPLGDVFLFFYSLSCIVVVGVVSVLQMSGI